MNTIEVHKLLEKIEAGEYTPAAPLEELLFRINDDTNDLIILCYRKKIKCNFVVIKGQPYHFNV